MIWSQNQVFSHSNYAWEVQHYNFIKYVEREN